MKIYLSLVLLTALGLASLPAVLAPTPSASSITISANPGSGTVDFFPAIPQYDDFSSALTVTGAVTGTPTWSSAPAPGSPSCANYIRVTFGNVNAWNTTATFDDHSSFPCNATIILTVTSTTGLVESIAVQVTYLYCRNCL